MLNKFIGGMIMEATTLNIRVDRKTKDKVKKIYDEWGLTLTAAVNIFF